MRSLLLPLPLLPLLPLPLLPLPLLLPTLLLLKPLLLLLNFSDCSLGLTPRLPQGRRGQLPLPQALEIRHLMHHILL